MAVKRMLLLAVLSALLLCGLSASAVPQLSGKLFQTAEAAVDYLTSGEYERLVTLLPFSGVAPSAAEWERFSRNYGDGVMPADGSSVAYWRNGSWNIAVPLSNYSDGSLEALVLLSKDGRSFTGYRYAEWDQVEAECESSESVVLY